LFVVDDSLLKCEKQKAVCCWQAFATRSDTSDVRESLQGRCDAAQRVGGGVAFFFSKKRKVVRKRSGCHFQLRSGSRENCFGLWLLVVSSLFLLLLVFQEHMEEFELLQSMNAGDAPPSVSAVPVAGSQDTYFGGKMPDSVSELFLCYENVLRKEASLEHHEESLLRALGFDTLACFYCSALPSSLVQCLATHGAKLVTRKHLEVMSKEVYSLVERTRFPLLGKEVCRTVDDLVVLLWPALAEASEYASNLNSEGIKTAEKLASFQFEDIWPAIVSRPGHALALLNAARYRQNLSSPPAAAAVVRAPNNKFASSNSNIRLPETLPPLPIVVSNRKLWRVQENLPLQVLLHFSPAGYEVGRLDF
jgi:hypothetical protein